MRSHVESFSQGTCNPPIKCVLTSGKNLRLIGDGSSRAQVYGPTSVGLEDFRVLARSDLRLFVASAQASHPPQVTGYLAMLSGRPNASHSSDG
jgi:hypothetical protein